MLAPLAEAPEVKITWWELRPKPPYPFPWPVGRFLDVFPESVLMIPPELEPLPIESLPPVDLVVLAHQAWYLAPSLPVTAFLQSPAAAVLKGRPVITVVNARDKWLTAQEKAKAALAALGARLIDNAAFIHEGNSFQHMVTTLRWMWTGKKEAFWGFPPAGVSEADIAGAARFGRAIGRALEDGTFDSGQPVLKGLGAVHVSGDLIVQEEIARAIFAVWAKWIHGVSRFGRFARGAMLLLFGACLLCLLLVAAPLALIVYHSIVAPLSRERIAKKRAYYEAPSGSGG
jgi:hypothetical protein